MNWLLRVLKICLIAVVVAVLMVIGLVNAGDDADASAMKPQTRVIHVCHQTAKDAVHIDDDDGRGAAELAALPGWPYVAGWR